MNNNIMSIERERKFLAKYIPDEAYLHTSTKEQIAQGYLMLSENQQLRIRITEGEVAQLAYKNEISEGIRYEFEYEIPVKDAIILFDQCKYKLHKVRYTFEDGDLLVELDEYPGGLLIAEIEFTAGRDVVDIIRQINDLPDYIDRDVTGVHEYSNIYIASKMVRA